MANDVARFHKWVFTGSLVAEPADTAEMSLYTVQQALVRYPKIASKAIFKHYEGELETWLDTEYGIQLEIVKREADQKGFAVQPRRWVVERTFAWLGNFRRLGKDYEQCPTSSEAMIYLASIRVLLKRLPD